MGVFCFQAEDGIRDWSVTGVQTCALPISKKKVWSIAENFPVWSGTMVTAGDIAIYGTMDRWLKSVNAKTGEVLRSEERRVGKEGRAGLAASQWTDNVRDAKDPSGAANGIV